jgi:glycosyltransferase involved in cell wall biosynthesis
LQVFQIKGFDVKIDVIIPVYNEEDYIVASVRSFLGQSLPVDTVIVVDDASTDRTAETVLKYFADNERVRLIRLPSNKGVSAARNKGAEYSRADWLLFAEGDGVYSFNYVRKLVSALGGKSAIASGGMRLPFNQYSPWGRFWRATFEARWFLSRISRRKIIGAWMYPRGLFQDLDGYDLTLSQGEDVDLACRAVQAGFESCWASQCFFYHNEPLSAQAVFRRFKKAGAGKPLTAKNVLLHAFSLMLLLPVLWPILMLIPEYRLALYRFTKCYSGNACLAYFRFTIYFIWQKMSVSLGFFGSRL